jgi:ABC-type Fe3+/spermidine/putrescine transport system ATPase subunit
MTVERNIAFGLKVARKPATEIKASRRDAGAD